MLGHEGPGSLFSELRTRGLATDICAGVENDGSGKSTHSTLVTMTIGLTEKGLWGGDGLGGEVLAEIWKYLSKMREDGV